MRTFFFIMIATTLLYGSYTRDAASETVYDDQTDLTWEDGINHRRNWADAIDYCETLHFGGAQDWRLPNINELLSIVDYNTPNRVINPAFHYLIAERHWSSTTSARDNEAAWYVNFADGYSRNFSKTPVQNPVLYVRCVRKGQIGTSSNTSGKIPAILYLLQ